MSSKVVLRWSDRRVLLAQLGLGDEAEIDLVALACRAGELIDHAGHTSA